MAICIDPSIRALKKLGYNAVRHPKAGLQPLLLLGRQRGEVAVLDTVDRLITNATGDLPAVTRDEATAGISGEKTGDLDAGIGLDILGAVIGAMGGNLGFKAAYKDARRIQFEFNDVRRDSILPGRLGDFLKAGEVDVGNLVFREYVAGNGELYVVTETVKSKKLSVRATSRKGGELAVEVPLIQDLLGGSVKVSAAAAGSSAIVYDGPVALTFGFKCFEIGVEDGRLSMVNSRPSGRLSFSLPGAAAGEPKPADISESGPLSFGL